MSYLSRDTASLSCFNKSALSVRLNLLLPPQGTYDFTERKDTRIGIKLLNPGRKRRGGRKKKKERVDLVGPACQRSVEGKRCKGEGRRGQHPGEAPVIGDSGHPRVPPRRRREPPPRTRGHNERRPWPGVEKKINREKKA